MFQSRKVITIFYLSSCFVPLLFLLSLYFDQFYNNFCLAGLTRLQQKKKKKRHTTVLGKRSVLSDLGVIAASTVLLLPTSGFTLLINGGG